MNARPPPFPFLLLRNTTTNLAESDDLAVQAAANSRKPAALSPTPSAIEEGIAQRQQTKSHNSGGGTFRARMLSLLSSDSDHVEPPEVRRERECRETAERLAEWGVRLDIAKQCTAALHHFHSQQPYAIVHMDIKSEQFLLTYDSSKPGKVQSKRGAIQFASRGDAVANTSLPLADTRQALRSRQRPDRRCGDSGPTIDKVSSESLRRSHCCRCSHGGGVDC
jgi:hypothetical protein